MNASLMTVHTLSSDVPLKEDLAEEASTVVQHLNFGRFFSGSL